MLKRHGGLNISASHNPPDDNGGKFYDERGGQPVPPDDQIMADLVEQVTADQVAVLARGACAAGRIHFLDDEPHQAYIELCCKQSLVPPPRFDEVKIVFTPLHGVGGMTALEMLDGAGLPRHPRRRADEAGRPVSQCDQVAQPGGARVDGPRCDGRQGRSAPTSCSPPTPTPTALAPCRSRTAKPGRLRLSHGQQIAALLTHFKLTKLTEQGRMPASPIVVKTLVTTGDGDAHRPPFQGPGRRQSAGRLQVHRRGALAAGTERQYEDVTGTPADFVIATEESHGILLTPQIRDKDAGAAALLLAELALDQKRARGKTVLDYLRSWRKQFGYFKNDLANIAMTGIEGKQQMAKMLDLLRQSPPQGDRRPGGDGVRGSCATKAAGWGRSKGATDFASRNFLIFRLGEGEGEGETAKIALRPSGTEPKAKAYVEVCSAPCPAGRSDAEWAATCREVDATAKRVAEDFLKMALGMVG